MGSRGEVERCLVVLVEGFLLDLNGFPPPKEGRMRLEGAIGLDFGDEEVMVPFILPWHWVVK